MGLFGEGIYTKLNLTLQNSIVQIITNFSMSFRGVLFRQLSSVNGDLITEFIQTLLLTLPKSIIKVVHISCLVFQRIDICQ